MANKSNLYINIKALVMALPLEQRAELARIVSTSLTTLNKDPQEFVLFEREPGENGKVIAVGFVHHDKDTGKGRITESGNLRINLKAKTQQATSQTLASALVTKADEVEKAQFGPTESEVLGMKPTRRVRYDSNGRTEGWSR